MAKKPETKFKEKVIRDLRALKAQGLPLWWVKTQQVSIRGTPDLLICARGIFIARELKASEKDSATELQTHTLAQIAEAGGNAAVVSPESWPAHLQAIETIARGSRPTAQ